MSAPQSAMAELPARVLVAQLPLAAAWARTPDAEARWKHQLGEAFRAITRREKITRRHAAFKRIASRWPDAARALSG